MTNVDFTVPIFVPGNRPERFAKAAASGADAIIIDLEDAVPCNAKEAARNALTTGFTDLPVLVRINAETTSWYEGDVAAVEALPLAALIVPKAEFGGGFAALAANSTKPVFALIETARGLADARQIAALPGVARLMFGSVDFCADLGCAHTREAMLMARSELVLASRLAGLTPPVDGVTTSIEDLDLITGDARHALELGFTGKLAIHPKQTEAISICFRPDAAEVEWANRVLASGEA